MKIEKMELENFKLFKSKIFDFEDHSIVMGDNGTGKSTILDAFSWCFFGKTADGRTDTEFVKPIINGETQHEVETVVRVTLNGKVFSRSQSEKWTKKRGQTIREFAGHKTVYEVDYVPVKKGDFTKMVEELVGDEKTFYRFTSPTIIPLLKKDELRDLVVGDTVDLKPLQEALIKLKAVRKKQNEEVKELPIRIDEAYSYIEETEEFDETILEAVNTEIEELTNEKHGILNSGVKSKLRDAVSVTRGNLTEIHAEIEADKRANDKPLDLTDWGNELERLRDTVGDANSAVNDEMLKSGQLDVARQELITEYRNIKADVFVKGADTCYACNQPLLNVDFEEQEETFNINKAKLLESNIAKGKALAEEIKDSSKIVKELQEKLLTVKSAVDAFKATKPIKEPYVTPTKLSYNLEKANKAMENAEAELENADFEDVSGAIEEIQDNINQLTSKRNSLLEAKARVDSIHITEKRVEKLKSELKERSRDLAETESSIYSTEQELRELMETAETSLNSRFEIVKWSLFEYQINGGVKEICVPTFDSIPYPNVNRAKQIDMGIDIINTLSKEKNVNYPIFVDNAECSNKILPFNGQTVYLYVTDNKTIKVEKVEKGASDE